MRRPEKRRVRPRHPVSARKHPEVASFGDFAARCPVRPQHARPHLLAFEVQATQDNHRTSHGDHCNLAR